MNKNKLDDESRFLVKNEHFLTKSSLSKYCIAPEAFSRISFVNCNFENIEVMGNVFVLCHFQNCTFNQFWVRKAQFSSCYFEGCKITNCNMTRAEFYKTDFTDCEFLSTDLAASDFDICKFRTTRFLKSDLNFIIANDVKVWESKEWVEVNDFSIFEKNSDK